MNNHSRTIVAFIVGLLLATSCNESVVVPPVVDPALCGNDRLDPGESCDGQLFASWVHAECQENEFFDASYLHCTSACEVDFSQACRTARCGNQVIDPGEECDSQTMPALQFACTDPDESKVYCRDCRIVDLGACETLSPLCGNGVLDEGELCDGTLFRSGSQTCPAGMTPIPGGTFRCLSSCQVIDVSAACTTTTEPPITCGNAQLDDGEACDGSLFAQDALENALADVTCAPGYEIDASRVRCSKDCSIDTSQVCRPIIYALISEVVPYLTVSGTSISLKGLAIELTNMDNLQSVDVTACALGLMNSAGVQITYPFVDFGVTELRPRTPLVLCDQDGEFFGDACDAIIPHAGGIVENLPGHALLGVFCGEALAPIDLLNLDSLAAAIQYGGVNFVRRCGAMPVTEPSQALLGEGWVISSDTTGAPTYGLGVHCPNEGAMITQCAYTIDRTTLTDRSQSVELALTLVVPGITDKTPGTDVNPGMGIEFIAGQLSGNNVSQSIIHRAIVRPDLSHFDETGVDRYIGTLRNYHNYEGFLSYDAGEYVLDAAITFDNGVSYIYCGPDGIIEDYKTYIEGTRNRLSVSYDDGDGFCGDGIIQPSEVCDGALFLPEALLCDNESEVIAFPDKVKCSCSMVNTSAACASPVPGCGDGVLADGEMCDGDQFNHEEIAKTCKSGTIYTPSRTTCTATCQANTANACLPKTQLVFDEFIIHYDGTGTIDAFAIAMVLNSDEPIDSAACTLSFLDSSHKLFSYISLYRFFPADSEDFNIYPCQSLVFCTQRSTTTVLGNGSAGPCDIYIRPEDFFGVLHKLAVIQLTCGGEFLDFFDVSGLKGQFPLGVDYGKTIDGLPWPNVNTVSLTQRMVLEHDREFSLEGFGEGCEP